jgi:hypothetical protein
MEAAALHELMVELEIEELEVVLPLIQTPASPKSQSEARRPHRFRRASL